MEIKRDIYLNKLIERKHNCHVNIIVKETMQLRRDEKGYVIMGIKEFLFSPNSLEF